MSRWQRFFASLFVMSPRRRARREACWRPSQCICIAFEMARRASPCSDSIRAAILLRGERESEGAIQHEP
eukprot:9148327-Heterocapsa_arctica.AAC.1